VGRPPHITFLRPNNKWSQCHEATTLEPIPAYFIEKRRFAETTMLVFGEHRSAVRFSEEDGNSCPKCYFAGGFSSTVKSFERSIMSSLSSAFAQCPIHFSKSTHIFESDFLR
jgi:hypothetical protein